jgi:antitoxin PrlF
MNQCSGFFCCREQSLHSLIDKNKQLAYNKSKEYIEFAEKGLRVMELAKITSKGQITIPIHIRKKLNIKDGDKVIFIEENGRVIMENSTKVALREVQNAFEGEAERVGLETEDDVVSLIKQIRTETFKKQL